jgi:hypothetical protein
MKTLLLFTSPGFGRWNDMEMEGFSTFSHNEDPGLRTGFRCPKCGRSVLAFNPPKRCSDHL